MKEPDTQFSSTGKEPDTQFSSTASGERTGKGERTGHPIFFHCQRGKNRKEPDAKERDGKEPDGKNRTERTGHPIFFHCQRRPSVDPDHARSHSEILRKRCSALDAGQLWRSQYNRRQRSPVWRASI